MRVVVTGGAGFIGRAVIKKLASGGVDVVALVRDPSKAGYLEQPRVALVPSDLSDVAAMTETMRGADGVIHAAGSYRLGIHKDERPAMLDANLGTTERVLDAAIAANVRRIVYVSTVNVFGNTHDAVVDETYRRDPKTKSGRFLSYYDESKYLAHLAAQERIAKGAPIVIVQPAQVYGPGDHSWFGEQLGLAYQGKQPYVVFGTTGVGPVHVDDLAEGIVAALIRGRVGQSYVMAGTPMRSGEAYKVAAKAGGRKRTRMVMPTFLLRLIAPLNDRKKGAYPGLTSNLKESISTGHKVTYWATSDKATRELGFEARPLEQGVRDTWGSTT
ncbi:MAG TPA: NAD-dependent epimerase/dehydratase family protein [Aeromicrobium sp.]|nr:NAD-dependent epimerase/dehydratase family protein [Aeromicrobium sp.]